MKGKIPGSPRKKTAMTRHLTFEEKKCPFVTQKKKTFKKAVN